MIRSILLPALLLALASPSFAAEKTPDANGPAVNRLRIKLPTGIPRGTAFQLVDQKKMKENSVHVVTSAEACLEFFGKETGAAIAKKVDFAKQDLAVIHWTLKGDVPSNWETSHTYVGQQLRFSFRRNKPHDGIVANSFTMSAELFTLKKGTKVDKTLHR